MHGMSNRTNAKRKMRYAALKLDAAFSVTFGTYPSHGSRVDFTGTSRITAESYPPVDVFGQGLLDVGSR